LKENKFFRHIIIVLLLLLTNTIYSQTTILGSLKNDKKEPVGFTNIIIKSQNKKKIVTYGYSDEDGNYQLKIDKIGKFSLHISAINYETVIVDIEITNKTKIITKNLILKEKAFELHEVIIQSNKPITIKKDIVIFNVKSFSKGNELVVEDLLKKLPGVIVDIDGTVRVGNREVEKIMIDGDDFFEKGYKILTKNMPPSQIDKIELLQKYSHNKLLKGIEDSDKIALNLVLKDKAKNTWFGNIKLGYDVTFNDRYSLQTNLMSFGKKNKYYFIAGGNNIGYDATGNINHLIRPFSLNKPASIGDNVKADELANLYSFTPNFKKSRTNFNNAKLVSLNAIFKLSKKTKLKTLGFFNWDENDFFRNSTRRFSLNNINFTNNETNVLRKKKFIGFAKIDWIHNISKTKMLEFTTKYNNKQEDNKNNLIFNEIQTNEKVETRNALFDQKITYTNKFNKHKVFLLTGRYISEKIPQNYTVNQFYFQELFPAINNVNNIEQESENKMQFIGFESHLMDRKKNGNLLELKFGNKYRKDKLTTSFLLKDNNIVIDKPTDYQKTTVYQSNDMYMKADYLVKLKKVSLNGKIEFHQLFNKLAFNNKQQPFFINPKLSFQWELNKKNKMLLSYANNTTNTTLLDVSNNIILTSFNAISKGRGEFNQLNESTTTFNYQLGNWSDKFFANVFVFYNKNHDFLANSSTLTPNYFQKEKIIIKDRNILSITSNFDRYIKVLSSNLKFNFGMSKSNYKNSVNQVLQEVQYTNYTYGLELRSGFKGSFNYHLGTKWTDSKVKTTINNSFTNNLSFLDLTYSLNKKINIQLQTERYYFGNIEPTNNTYYFADFEANYMIKKNKINFSLSAKNLFNTNTYKIYSANDVSTYTATYKLLPRYILVKIEYRF